MDKLLLQTAIVFLPGLIWTAVVDVLTSKGKPRSTPSLILRAFSFGIASYFLFYVGYYPIFRLRYGVWPTLLDGLKGAPMLDDFRLLRPRDIFYSSLVAFVASVVWSWAANRKCFLRLMRAIHVTSKFGEESLWSYVFNLASPTTEYVNIRDFERKVVYSGYVMAFSEDEGPKEIFLQDVRVCDSDSGSQLFEMPAIYLSYDPKSLHIEFPFQTKEKINARQAANEDRRRKPAKRWGKSRIPHPGATAEPAADEAAVAPSPAADQEAIANEKAAAGDDRPEGPDMK